MSQNQNYANDVTKILIGFLIGFLAAGASTINAKNHFIQMVACGMFAAFSSFFLQFAYQPGHIFSRWFNFLEEKLQNHKNPTIASLAKPLGLCAYCQNVWLVWIFFPFFYILLGTSWWMFLPSMVMAHFILTCLDKAFWQS